MIDLKPEQRVDWWRIVQDLHMHGYTVEAIQSVTGIPKSTVLGYKNLHAEPKHADGERLMNMWRRCMVPPAPLLNESVRTGRRVTR